MVRRVAMISMHTSPLAAPGVGDAGGLNVYVCSLARALADLDVEVDIFTRARTPNVRRVVDLSPGVRVITLPAGPLHAVPKEELPAFVTEFAGAIARFARENSLDYDIVHGHYWLSGLVGLRLRGLWQVPLVQMFHTLSRLKSASGVLEANEAAGATRARGESRILSDADAIVTATAVERRALLAAYEASASVVHTIPCGVDTTLFHAGDAEAARRTLGLLGTRSVVAVGRFDPLKGFDVLLRAAAILCAARPELKQALRVVIVGGSPKSYDGPQEYRNTLLRLADELNLRENLVLAGPVRPAELSLYYRAAVACSVPSFYESFGLTALEAMACATPVIASAVGGLQLTVHDGQNGYLVPPGDPAALATSLEALFTNANLRWQLAQGAARSVEPYSWRTIGERMLCLYEDLAGQQRIRSTA